MQRSFSRLASAIALVTASGAGLALAPPALAAGAMLEEVVVTAQRREQSLMDVPISISTVSGDDIKDILMGADDIRALGTRVPSLYTESSNGRVAPRFYIRGLGNTDFDLAASQPVSVVVDEVVQENVILKSFPLFDIAQVEVLKGPQGSLFGRNTPAGIVKIDTVKPSHESSGYINTSLGSYQTLNVEGAFGGSLVEDVLAGRISVLYQDREDYIDNALTGQDEALGGFDELAWRGQLLWTPNDRLSVLGNLHGRELDGTAPAFRANVIGPGDDNLNDNFDRDTVFFDSGNNNPQEYESFGGSVRVDYDLGNGYTVTSITGYEETDGFSLGDIDGGAGVGPTAQPAPIPFPSTTRDGIDDLEQWTQELRVSFAEGPMNWQAGLFFFDSELEITTDPFFAPPTTVKHTNESWAVFGQVSYDLSERLNLTVGGRWTDDEKELEALAANFPVTPVDVDGDELSWDIALSYALAEEMTVYTRLARGFRAPTIQARDVAFFAPPTTADSETITSFEYGFKSEVLDRTLRLNAAAFLYQIEDQQLSAIGGAGNLVQLVNADEGTGYGFESDATWLATENLSFGLGFSWNKTELEDDGLAVAPCGSGICTVNDPLDANGNALVSGNPFPHAPETILFLTMDYAESLGAGGEVFFSSDYARQGKTQFFLYDSEEFQSSGNFELGARLGYRRTDGSWEVSLFGRNITGEENLKGGIDFNNNTGFVNEPRIVGAQFRMNFGD
jgi:outer membrane receptor protein involved in Fe transport